MLKVQVLLLLVVGVELKVVSHARRVLGELDHDGECVCVWRVV